MVGGMRRNSSEGRLAREARMMLLARRRKERWLGAACCFAVFWLAAGDGGAAAQQGAPQADTPSTPTLTVTAREVLMDVVVTDASGRPVPGLTASDFKVTEEGAPQEIRHLTEHEPMSEADLSRLAAAPSLAPNTFTNYIPVVNTNASTVILLDAMDTPVAVQMRLREQVIGYLKHMQPGASLAIFQLDTEMHLIQGFSSDPKALLAAAESKRDMPSMAKPFYGNGETNELARMQILRDGMQTLGRYLAGFPGRKNLIWFTAQVPAELFYGNLGSSFRDTFDLLEEASSDPAELTGALTVSRVAVYPVDTRGVQGLSLFDASHGSAPTGNYTIANANRQSLNEANLDRVAAATGGKAYYNTNDMKQVIEEVVADGSDYYTLAYSTTNTNWSGEFRRVKIAVDRPGVKLECRPGYYAIDRSTLEQRQLARLKRGAIPALDGETAEMGVEVAPTGHGKNGFAVAMNLGAVPPTEIVFTASLRAGDATAKLEKNAPLPEGNFLRPAWRGKPYRSYTIQFHTDARGISLTRRAAGRRQGRVEFVAIVYDQQAAVVNTAEKTVILNLDEAGYRKLLAEGMALAEQIAVPAKGNYFLRLGVRDVDGDHLGALEIPVDQVKLGS